MRVSQGFHRLAIVSGGITFMSILGTFWPILERELGQRARGSEFAASLPEVAQLMAAAPVAAVVVYGAVRVIGWVVAGFAEPK